MPLRHAHSHRKCGLTRSQIDWRAIREGDQSKEAEGSDGRAVRRTAAKEALMATLSVSRRDFLVWAEPWSWALRLTQRCRDGHYRKMRRREHRVFHLGKALDVHEVDSFLAFHANGDVKLYTSKVDVGTGMRIAISQMAAEELGIPVEVNHCYRRRYCVDSELEGGTEAVRAFPLEALVLPREAAATARQGCFLILARRSWVGLGELIIADGVVRPTAGGNGVTIASLLNGKQLAIQVDPKAPLKDPSTYSVVGKPTPRTHVPGKCTGNLYVFTRFHGSWKRPARPKRSAARNWGCSVVGG